MRKPGAAPADQCSADRTSIPTAIPIPTAGLVDTTTTRRTDPSTTHRSEGPPPPQRIDAAPTEDRYQYSVFVAILQ